MFIFIATGKNRRRFKNLKKTTIKAPIIAFCDSTKPIILRTEASFKQGLSAGLFQETATGIKPVHFISRTITESEKHYSQTEKDALAIKWAKNRFRMYLLGAPKFKIITAHKPLIPFVSKV